MVPEHSLELATCFQTGGETCFRNSVIAEEIRLQVLNCERAGALTQQR